MAAPHDSVIRPDRLLLATDGSETNRDTQAMIRRLLLRQTPIEPSSTSP
jgi:hypothetical protein